MSDPALRQPAPRRPASAALLATTGVLLIVVPVVATVLKLAFPGWYLVIIVLTGVILLLAAGFVMQIIIAVTGFLTRRAVFRTASGAGRAIIASWITSIALLLTVFFLPEGGDSSYGSIFAILIGAESDAAVSDVSTLLFLITGIVWVAGWAWLLVEWIRAIAARRRANAPAAPSA